MFSRLRSALGAEDKGLRATMKDALASRIGGKAEPAKAEPAKAEPELPVAAKPMAPVSPGLPVAAKPMAPVSPGLPVAAEPVAAVSAPAAAPEAPEPRPEAVRVPAEPAAEVTRPAAEAARVPEAAPAAAPAPRPKPEAPAVAERPGGEAKPPAAPSLNLAAAAAAASRTPEKLLHADTGSTDLEHYVARAKANNRDVGAIRGGVGLNRADDGTPYWGPVDNESSRAKAAGHLLAIDQWECISCGTCVEQTDKVFVLPADGKASPIAQDGPMDLIQDALEACPVTCIHWVSEDEAAERGLATGTEVG